MLDHVAFSWSSFHWQMVSIKHLPWGQGPEPEPYLACILSSFDFGTPRYTPNKYQMISTSLNSTMTLFILNLLVAVLIPIDQWRITITMTTLLVLV